MSQNMAVQLRWAFTDSVVIRNPLNWHDMVANPGDNLAMSGGYYRFVPYPPINLRLPTGPIESA
jgi:hypothetical protein